MAYTQKQSIITLFTILFLLFSFVFLCYLFFPSIGRIRMRLTRNIAIEPLDLPHRQVNDENDDEDEDLRQITIDIPENRGDGNGTLMLLGDSILANEKYVPEGKSLSYFLKKEVGSDVEVTLFATDNYTIDDVYFQINSIHISYYSKKTSIVLSVGGNNFLTGTPLGLAKKEYLFLIEHIRETFGECKIYLVNLYLPFDPLLQKLYEKIVVEWNLFLEGVVDKGGANGIVDISRVITEPKDLVSKIEPSVIGGEKIAGAIVNEVSV